MKNIKEPRFKIKKPERKTVNKYMLSSTLALLIMTILFSAVYGLYSFNRNYIIKWQLPVRTPVWIESRVKPTNTPTPKNQGVKKDSTKPILTPTPKKTSFIPQAEASGKVFEGKVSHYSREGCLGCDPNFIMANGEPLDDNALTIAVPPGWLSMGTLVRVTNLDNGKSVIARVTDTGGFLKYNRIADLTLAVASALETKTDVSNVRIEKI